jgi:hypothetical protein
MSLLELMAKYRAGAANSDPKPKASALRSLEYDRNPVVAAIAKVRAGFH